MKDTITGQKVTPKQVALRMVRVALNSLVIENEIDYYEMTEREKKLVEEQFDKVYDRIEKRYLSKGLSKVK